MFSCYVVLIVIYCLMFKLVAIGNEVYNELNGYLAVNTDNVFIPYVLLSIFQLFLLVIGVYVLHNLASNAFENLRGRNGN